MKKISVVMPCLNAETYIEEALYSIFNQSDNDVELIVIDGCSTDRTLQILQNCQWPIAKIISEKDQGANDALNKGFDIASGDILCWLNADDVYIYKHTFAEVKSIFSAGDVNFAYGHSICINNAGKTTKTLFSWPMNFNDYKKGSNIFTGSVFFSSNAWNNFGKFSLLYKVTFEHELLDYLFQEYQPHFINKHLAALRQYPGTLSNRLRGLMNQERQQLRGSLPTQDLGYQTRRAISLMNEGLALKVVKNKYSDLYADQHWLDIFRNS